MRVPRPAELLRTLLPFLSLLASVAGLALAPRAAAARQLPDTVPLSELVVTATRLPTPRHAVPAAVTVITGDELRARGVHRLVDALRVVAGAHLVSSGPTGSLASLFLRGGEADYVQVLVDGVPVNDPGGAYDFGQLATLNVDRMEVLRGPASVLYGSDAVAGVVQVFTREASGAPRVFATLEGGTFDKRGVTISGAPASGRGRSVQADAAVSGGSGSLRYSLGVGHHETDGLLPVNNDYANTSGSARLRWSAPWGSAAATLAGPSRSDVSLTLRVTDNEYHYPTDGSGRVVDVNQRSSGLATALGLEAGHFFSERVEARASATLHRRSYAVDDRPDTPSDTLGFYASRSDDRTRRSRVDARANVHLERGVVTLGATAEWQKGSSELLSQSEFGPFESASENTRSTRAGYAQLLARPAERVTLTLGGRLEDSERFGSFPTYRVGANVRVGANTTVRAALGTAFKEPTFFENFAQGFVRGNPELDPERSRTREVGALHAFAAGSLSVTAFDQRFEDMIQYDPRPTAERPGEANYFNLAEARSRGLEAEARLRPAERLELEGSWTVLDTEVLDAGAGGDRAFIAGEALLRRPAHSGDAAATVAVTRALRATLGWSWVGSRDDLDFSTSFEGARVALDAYSSVDVGLALDVASAAALGPVTVTARVRNLADERYEEIRGFPAPGRALYLGVRTGGAR
jgi:vitamin B12 transporter